ncbi:pyridoxamine 5'-phosphate oxidase [Homoserinimonas aerilata]|uniref:Pyridoxamine 5'-phosphate oxidase n=1 Tax=Homoserinimonas aerilata TaxID=1162970 RepID=A0A542YGV3_9MICO|nr:pyridoxal 5'-phosphate synthase [Homoserinimonas aerilata]TQL47214.1 pyridoxamine 5'-phosphate oxidase [Homoserinimonas aerilata]
MTAQRRPPHLDTISGTIDLELPEFDAPPSDPFAVLRDWVAAAVRVGVAEPFAVSLATADAHGRPSNRTVLAKSLDASGLLFVSSGGSAKGSELAANPYAAALMYWKETRQQLRLSGRVTPIAAAESDAMFAARPIAAQASAVASHQSEPLADPAGLRAEADSLAAAGLALTRPADWGGYLLRPDTIEFWHGSVDRLHRRLRYELTPAGWTHTRLYP